MVYVCDVMLRNVVVKYKTSGVQLCVLLSSKLIKMVLKSIYICSSLNLNWLFVLAKSGSSRLVRTLSGLGINIYIY